MERKKRKALNVKSKVDPLFLNTGSTLLDKALGKGLKLGRIVNIVGDKSTGKTLLCLEIIYQALKRYKGNIKIRYNDCETGLNFNTKLIWGFDIEPYSKNPSKTVEELREDIYEQIKNKKKEMPLIYVVDSLDGLKSEEETKREEKKKKEAEEDTSKKKKGSYNLSKPKFLSNFFSEISEELSKNSISFIIISQIRDKIGITFGPTKTRSGGKALDFYCAQIIWLSELGEIKKLERLRPAGIKVLAHITKNKLGLPYRKAPFNILFNYGIDDISANVDFLFDLITDKGKTRKKIKEGIKWDGEEFKKREELIDYIIENNQEEKIIEEVKLKWDELDDESVYKNRKKKTL